MRPFSYVLKGVMSFCCLKSRGSSYVTQNYGSGHVSCTTYHIYGYVYIPNVDFLILKSSVHFPTITASNLSESSPKSMTIMTELDDNALHQMMLSLCNLQSPDHPVVLLYVFNVVLFVKKRLEAFCP